MDPKQRFSSRVENYERYRPSYPPAVIDTLRVECGLSPQSIVADIGSGTGLFSRLFLDFGCRVFGVEPNPEMRAAGERQLSGYPRFTSLDGSAESTGLEDASVDFAVAGQAFHWFDPPGARSEFARILRPEGWVVLAWNERRLDSSPFQRDYEALLQAYSTDYNQVNHYKVAADPHTIPSFFGGEYRVDSYDNRQEIDYIHLEGGLLSASYTPQPGDPSYQPMLAELWRIFDHYQQGGKVTYEIETRMFSGRLR
jgi:SAM-dependent methyltransferase